LQAADYRLQHLGGMPQLLDLVRAQFKPLQVFNSATIDHRGQAETHVINSIVVVDQE
jgi:hypothetical protein